MIFEIPLGVAAFLFLLVLGFTRSWKRALQVALLIAVPLAVAFVAADALGLWWLFHKIERALTDAGWSGDSHLLNFIVAALTLSSYAVGRMFAWVYKKVYNKRGLAGVVTSTITAFVVFFAIWNLAWYAAHRLMTPASQTSQQTAAAPALSEIAPRHSVHLGDTDITFDSCTGSGHRVVCVVKVVNQADHDESLAWSSDVVGTDSQGDTHAASGFDIGGLWPTQEKFVPHVSVSAHVQFQNVAGTADAFQDLRFHVCCSSKTHWWGSGDSVTVDLTGAIQWAPPPPPEALQQVQPEPSEPVGTANNSTGASLAASARQAVSLEPMPENVGSQVESKVAAASPSHAEGTAVESAPLAKSAAPDAAALAQTNIFLIISRLPASPSDADEPDHHVLPAANNRAPLLGIPAIQATLSNGLEVALQPTEDTRARELKRVKVLCGDEPSPKAPTAHSDFVWCRYFTLRGETPPTRSTPK